MKQHYLRRRRKSEEVQTTEEQSTDCIKLGDRVYSYHSTYPTKEEAAVIVAAIRHEGFGATTRTNKAGTKVYKGQKLKV